MNTTECQHSQTMAIEVPAFGYGQAAQTVSMCVACLALVEEDED